MQAEQAAPSIESATPEGRVAWVDTARGLGILLVMIGHCQAIPEQAVIWIFAFHMPLFFFLSGFTFGRNRERAIGAVLSSRARSLLVPFVFFWLASYAFWLVERRFKADEALLSPWRPLDGLWIAAGETLFVNQALWFLTCLFVTTALYRVALTLGERAASLLVALLGVAAAWGLERAGSWMLWNVDIACAVLPFFALGDRAAQGRWVERHARRLPLAACAGLALTLAAVALGERVDLHRRVTGNPLWFYAAALGGIALVIAVSRALPALRALHTLGRESLTLLATHLPVYTIIAGVGVVAFHLPRGFKGTLPWFVLVDVGAAIAIGLIVAAGLRRYLPAALGAPRATRPLKEDRATAPGPP